MNIVVPIKLVPDLVEELEINDEGPDLERDFLSYRINEFDDHALEEALQLKEQSGGSVTVVALEREETDKVLYTALAKGADKAVKITGLDEDASSHTAAKAMCWSNPTPKPKAPIASCSGNSSIPKTIWRKTAISRPSRPTGTPSSCWPISTTWPTLGRRWRWAPAASDCSARNICS